MRIAILIGAALILAGCDRAAEKAEEEFYFLSKNDATSERLCEVATKVRDAWSARQEREKYRNWELTARTYCLNAEMKRLTP